MAANPTFNDAVLGNAMYGNAALSPGQRARQRSTEQQVANLQGALGNLQKRLAIAEEDFGIERIQRDATSHVLSLALEALKKADPNSPLLNEGYRREIKKQRLATTLKTAGYKFDIDTGRIELKYKRT